MAWCLVTSLARLTASLIVHSPSERCVDNFPTNRLFNSIKVMFLFIFTLFDFL